MKRDYKGVIWTNHALDRMRERGIKQGDAWATFNRPDTSRYAKSNNTHVYYRTWGSEKIEVVAKKSEKGEWLVLSVWSKLADNKTAKKSENTFWRKLKKSIGGY
jgi:hypothetical protein